MFFRERYKTFLDVFVAVGGSFTDLLRTRPLLIITAWSGVFAVLLSLSLMLDIVPKLDTTNNDETEEQETSVVNPEIVNAETASENPIRIIIDSIDVDVSVVTPASTAVEILDEALLGGVVHYPASAKLGEVGNVFLFGHSTGFRVVNNSAFKVFNNLKDLKEQDLIRLQSSSEEHIYRVTSVRLVNADEALVDLSLTGRKLTLSTCNTFGAKQERYVVEAEFIGVYDL